MSATETGSPGHMGKQEQARQLAQDALQAQQAGDDAKADQLFEQASQLDPDVVADVLRRRGATPLLTHETPLLTAPLNTCRVDNRRSKIDTSAGYAVPWAAPTGCSSVLMRIAMRL